MTQHRESALSKLVDEIDGFSIPQDYFDDLEPQSFIDTWLTGKIDSLRSHCDYRSWSDLYGQLLRLTPIRASAPEALCLLHDFIVPEIRSRQAENPQLRQSSDFWSLIHPKISEIAKPRLQSGHNGDAVEACFKEINSAVKEIVKNQTGRELDRAGLMTTAFSVDNPIVKLNEQFTVSDRDEQKGYMKIFEGSITGIRNPKAHANLNPPVNRALHLIMLASLLMWRIDERI